MALPGTISGRLTAEEFLADYRDAWAELIDGEVVEMAPAGGQHGKLEMTLMARVAVHCEDHGVGTAYGPSTGFVVGRGPDVVLQPDGAVLVGDASKEPPDGFVESVPDLVLEVVSPSDRAGDVRAKVLRWLDAGARVVWVAYPALARIDVWRGADDLASLGREDVLTCDDLLPGFALPLSRVFRPA